MFVIYISKYEKDGAQVDTPLCIYDKRSPAEDLRCINPQLNLEDSRAGDLTITLPLGHFAYDYIKKGITRISMYRLDIDSTAQVFTLNEKLVFEGPIRKISNDFNKDKILYAEGFFSFLNESVQPERQYFDITLDSFLRNLITYHNETMEANGENDKKFVLDTVEINYPDTDSDNNHKSEFEATQFGTTMEYFLAIQQAYGGHFIFSKQNDGYHISYVRNLPKNTGQEIRFGENLLDFMTEDDTSDICACCVPISSVNNTALSEVGDPIVSSVDAIADADKIKHGQTPDKWLKGVDEFNRTCMVLHETPKVTSTTVVAYCYLDRENLDPDDSSVPVNGYLLRRKITGTGTNVEGDYQIVENPFGSTYYSDHRIIRYFPKPDGEVLYLTGRPENIGNDRQDSVTGDDHYDYSGMWTSYMYRGGASKNVLQYQSAGDNIGFNSIEDVKFDNTYNPNGKSLYVDHYRVNNGVKELMGYPLDRGEIVVYGYGKELPVEIKRAKYNSNINKDVGAQITDGITIYDGQVLAKDSDAGRYWFYTVWVEPMYDVYALDCETLPEGTKGVLVSARTLNYSSGTLTGDAAIVVYSPDPGQQTWIGEQINIIKNEREGFTSNIYYLIDLEDPANKGAKWIKVSSWGSSFGWTADALSGNVEAIKNAPVKFYIYKKNVDKLNKYVTAEGANADNYHEANSLYVKDQNLIDKYGYSEKRIEFNGIEDPNVLVKRAEAYLIDNQFGNMKIDVNGVDLHELDINVEAFDISTAIKVVSSPHNLDQFFEIESLSINPDQPELNTISLTETNEGRFSGILPCSILTDNNFIRNLTVYGTRGDGLVGDITITITSVSDPTKTASFTHAQGSSGLKYPNTVIFGTLNQTSGDYEIELNFSGLMELTINVQDAQTGEKPVVTFEYDKVKDGQ